MKRLISIRCLPIRSLAMGLLCAALSPLALAQTFVLDDSTSPKSRVVPKSAIDEQGRPLNKSLEPDRAILRFGEVMYRLDMRPHLGQQARVYFVRAPETGPATGTRLNWSTRSGNLQGSLLGGDRALIWSGKVTEPWMSLGIQLDLDFDLQRWLPSVKLGNTEHATYFELER